LPKPVQRVAVCIGALSATLLVGGLGGGVAMAGPGVRHDKGNTSDSGHATPIRRAIGAVTGNPGSSHPIRDMIGPKGVLGSIGAGGVRTGAQVSTNAAPRELGPVATQIRNGLTVIRGGSVAVLVLPGNIAVASPVPKLAAAPATVYTVDLRGHVVAYSTARSTYEAANTLSNDVVVPYNPFRTTAAEPEPDPEPEPQPQLKVYEVEPNAPEVVDVVPGSGGNGGGIGAENLGILQTPTLAPIGVRLAPPRPVAETGPGSGGTGEVAGVPGVRGAEARPTKRVEEPIAAGATPPAGNPFLRQGFPQYLRNARTVDLLSVALPGVAGLVAITAAGSAVGYRQANSGRYLRADAARFLK
jgi:hypothetical protein